MRSIAVIILITILVLHLPWSCKSKTADAQPLEIGQLMIKEIEILDTRFMEGNLTGVDLERDQAFLLARVSTQPGKHELQAIDISTGQVQTSYFLESGSFKAPSTFYNPTFVKRLDDRYYFFDQSHKIVVFDSQMKYLDGNIFEKFRSFADFYKNDGQVYFVVNLQGFMNTETMNRIEIYELLEDKRPRHNKTLFENSFHNADQFNRGNRKAYHEGMLWPSNIGFEKDGIIYYSSMAENLVYMYHIQDNRTEVFQFTHLKPRKFTEEEADRFGSYKEGDSKERFLKQTGRRFIHLAYPDSLFHYGICDVGKDKIAIVGDIDFQPESMKCRFDVFGVASKKYLGSIWLPVGRGIQYSLSTENLGYDKYYIDLDRGMYLWNDIEGEDYQYGMKITKFTVKGMDNIISKGTVQ